uniref:Uncharacterized protein n=1 Tax=Haplochromis burtoni TaxID=8153 RepID=A0A3Q2WYW3_HAPBU
SLAGEYSDFTVSASQLQLLLTKDAAVNGSSDDKHGVVALNPELQVAKRSKAKELQSSSETIQTSTIACKVCGLQGNQDNLIQHAWSHVDESPAVCGICGERFESVETLKGHLTNDPKYHNSNNQMSLQTEAKQYKCETCIHSNERPHICLVCKKAFIYKGSLKAHMRMHTGEKPYSCSQCGRSFKHKCHLNDHVRSHSGIKQLFHCPLCPNFSPTVRAVIEEHISGHIKNALPFKGMLVLYIPYS